MEDWSRRAAGAIGGRSKVAFRCLVVAASSMAIYAATRRPQSCEVDPAMNLPPPRSARTASFHRVGRWNVACGAAQAAEGPRKGRLRRPARNRRSCFGASRRAGNVVIAPSIESVCTADIFFFRPAGRPTRTIATVATVTTVATRAGRSYGPSNTETPPIRGQKRSVAP